MKHARQVALITGANQGIGYEIARTLAAHDITVLVGSRDPARGRAAAEKIGARAHPLQLDVTDPASVARAATEISETFGRLDILVQNAAISHTSKQPGQSLTAHAVTVRPGSVSIAEVRQVWETNVFGVLRVYQEMLPLLRGTPGSRIINLSSGMASLAANADPEYLSIGVQTGPPIGAQKGPPFTMAQG